MKKLLLIPLLFFITPDAKADMDYVCYVSYVHEKGYPALIKENCERDNIVFFTQVPRRSIPMVIADWCRHDREINFVEDTRHESRISCVLYDNKPRKTIVMKGL